MLGLAPWMWAATAGWFAKGFVSKAQNPKPAQSKPGAPGATATAGTAPAPPARTTPCQFDPHMDEATEKAVLGALAHAPPADLRGFADYITKTPPLYPIAAGVLRYRANQVEAAAMHARAAQQAHVHAPVPAPAPAPAPAPVAAPPPAPAPAVHANGVAKTVVAPPAPAPVVSPAPEG